jgi:hypothetical protein
VTTIFGEEALGVFRSHWDGPRLIALIAEHGGGVLINWPIGVGKSHALDRIIEAAVGSGSYDLVVAMFPTRRVLEERAWIRTPPPGVKIVNIRPRPRPRCGDLDVAWRHFEAAGMAALGRIELCGRCPRRPDCFWPTQYGAGLQGAQVIFATHAHLGRVPDFAAQLAGWAGADRVLTLLDEIGFAVTSFRRRVTRRDLALFADVLDAMPRGREIAPDRDWGYLARLLLRAPTTDLRSTTWRLPFFSLEWAIAVQARGWEAHGARFRFLGHDLQQFGRSPLDSRERHANGDLSFAAPPAVRGDVAIFSGTALPEFLRFRLGRDLACPFAGYRFGHPGTRWYNLASRLGMRTHFSGNANQVLDFFAGLVSRRLGEGRRPLLIAKKRYVSLCAAGLRRRLGEYHPAPVEIVTGDWDTIDLMRPDVIPLINFGMIGTNLFEHFNCAYCLTGFYVNAEVVDAILQDVLASDGHIPIAITTEGSPRRRRARAQDPTHRYYDVNRLAQYALDQQEMDSVIQAVGRVRPYTRPREIVTFQCAGHPQLDYDREFNSIEEARRFFEIPPRRERERDRNADRVRAARQSGMTQIEAAAALQLGRSTVQRYWNRAPEGPTNPS